MTTEAVHSLLTGWLCDRSTSMSDADMICGKGQRSSAVTFSITTIISWHMHYMSMVVSTILHHKGKMSQKWPILCLVGSLNPQINPFNFNLVKYLYMQTHMCMQFSLYTHIYHMCATFIAIFWVKLGWPDTLPNANQWKHAGPYPSVIHTSFPERKGMSLLLHWTATIDSV